MKSLGIICVPIYSNNFTYKGKIKELAWRSGCVMDCHATARGSIPGGNGVKTELHILCKGQ